MWRVQGIVERMGRSLTESASMLDEALRAMDIEMIRLQRRLDADALRLTQVIATIELTDTDRAQLTEATSAMVRTAHLVAGFAHRPADADDQIDALLRQAVLNLDEAGEDIS